MLVPPFGGGDVAAQRAQDTFIPAGGRLGALTSSAAMGVCDEKNLNLLRQINDFSRRTPHRQRS